MQTGVEKKPTNVELEKNLINNFKYELNYCDGIPSSAAHRASVASKEQRDDEKVTCALTSSAGTEFDSGRKMIYSMLNFHKSFSINDMCSSGERFWGVYMVLARLLLRLLYERISCAFDDI